jgi:hypothetical protein
MRSTLKLSILAVALVGLQSCAAMFTGTKSTVLIDSEPQGVPFAVGKVTGVTPQSVEIPKKAKSVTFTPANAEPVTMALKRRFQYGMLALDILFTPGYGAVGIAVDGATGAWYRHEPAFFANLAGAPPVARKATSGSELVAARR